MVIVKKETVSFMGAELQQMVGSHLGLKLDSFPEFLPNLLIYSTTKIADSKSTITKSEQAE
jgi:hypothetical protein